MVRCLLAFLVAAAVMSGSSWNDVRFISVRDSINNNPASTWKAAIHASIPYDNQETLQRMCGSTLDATLLRQNSQTPPSPGSNSAPNSAAGNSPPRRLQAVPSNYDLRQAFPACWSVSNIRNQANCGSCWAVSALSSLSDRYCVKSTLAGAPQQKSFSYEDALECCSAGTCGTGPNRGCNGGYIHGGFAYAATNGVVTGENFMNYTTCKPYFLNPAGGYGSAMAPSCSQSCSNSVLYPRSYAADKTFIRGYSYITANTIAQVVANVQQAIMQRGSVVAGMDVYYDFYYYVSGVFVHNPNYAYLGGHAVRVIGWGVDSATNLPFWLVANSWGSGWGIGGVFKILRGSNHCRIESFMVEGLLK